MKKKKALKIITTSSFIFCSLVLLVGLLFVRTNKIEEQIITENLIVNEGTSSDSNIKLKANARVESGVTKVSVEAVTKGNVSGTGSWYNSQLNWSLEWAVTKSDHVNEYVKLDVLSNTAVELTYLKQFDTQIILKATSAEVSGVFATCTVDCYKRSNFENYQLQFKGKEYAVNLSEGYFNLGEVVSERELVIGRPVDLVIVNNDTKVGTIETTTNVGGYYTLSSELAEALTAQGYTNFKEIEFENFAQQNVFKNIEYMCSNSFELLNKQTGEMLNPELHEILEDIACWFTLYLEGTDSYDGDYVNCSTFEIDIITSYTPLFGQIDSVTLQKDSIIF